MSVILRFDLDTKLPLPVVSFRDEPLLISRNYLSLEQNCFHSWQERYESDELLKFGHMCRMKDKRLQKKFEYKSRRMLQNMRKTTAKMGGLSEERHKKRKGSKTSGEKRQGAMKNTNKSSRTAE